VAVAPVKMFAIAGIANITISPNPIPQRYLFNIFIPPPFGRRCAFSPARLSRANLLPSGRNEQYREDFKPHVVLRPQLPGFFVGHISHSRGWEPEGGDLFKARAAAFHTYKLPGLRSRPGWQEPKLRRSGSCIKLLRPQRTEVRDVGRTQGRWLALCVCPFTTFGPT